MKALTVWEPWASLIAIGAKPYEFRKWRAPASIVGQRIAIHAGARPVRVAEVRGLLIGLRGSNPGRHALKPGIALEFLDKVLVSPERLSLSHVVCTVRLGQPKRADAIMDEFGYAVENDSDRDAMFNFAWPMLDIEPMQPPVPARGAQGFWEISL